MLCVAFSCDCMFVVVDLDWRHVCSAMVMNLMLAWLVCVHAGWCAGSFASFQCRLLFRDSGLIVGFLSVWKFQLLRSMLDVPIVHYCIVLSVWVECWVQVGLSAECWVECW